MSSDPRDRLGIAERLPLGTRVCLASGATGVLESIGFTWAVIRLDPDSPRPSAYDPRTDGVNGHRIAPGAEVEVALPGEIHEGGAAAPDGDGRTAVTDHPGNAAAAARVRRCAPCHAFHGPTADAPARHALCAVCGAPLPAPATGRRRRWQRFCSARCRKRAHRGQVADVRGGTAIEAMP